MAITQKSQNMENTQMPITGWINNLRNICAIDCYVATQQKAILRHATAQASLVNLNNMLSERSQHGRPQTGGLHSQDTSQAGKSTDTESSSVVARGWREGRMMRDCQWGAAFFLGWSKCSGIREGGWAHSSGCTKVHKTVCFKHTSWNVRYVNDISTELLLKKVTARNHIVTPLCRGLAEPLCLLRITCCKKHTICSEEEMIYFPTTRSPQRPTIKPNPKEKEERTKEHTIRNLLAGTKWN